jgi:hypothetical protein
MDMQSVADEVLADERMLISDDRALLVICKSYCGLQAGVALEVVLSEWK